MKEKTIQSLQEMFSSISACLPMITKYYGEEVAKKEALKQIDSLCEIINSLVDESISIRRIKEISMQTYFDPENAGASFSDIILTIANKISIVEQIEKQFRPSKTYSDFVNNKTKEILELFIEDPKSEEFLQAISSVKSSEMPLVCRDDISIVQRETRGQTEQIISHSMFYLAESYLSEKDNDSNGVKINWNDIQVSCREQINKVLDSCSENEKAEKLERGIKSLVNTITKNQLIIQTEENYENKEKNEMSNSTKYKR